ncbi:MAG: GldM family protein, partial [Bacteroidia bacterium]
GTRTYTKAALQAQTLVVAGSGSGYIRGLTYTVKSFNMTIVHPRNGLGGTIRVNGQVLSPEAKQAIATMAPGSIVIFDNVKINNYSDPIPGLTLITNR